jgi:hypothetical protein
MKKLLVLTMVLAICGVANAATVTYWVEVPSAGNYEVKCSVSTSDNYGLSLYYVDLEGVDTVVNDGPLVQYWATLPPPGGWANYIGFVLFRSGTGTIPPEPLGGSQDNVSSPRTTVQIRGVGQNAIDMATDYPPPLGYTFQYTPSDGQVAADALLGHGTFSGDTPTINAASSEAVVFSEASGDDVEYATVVVPAPEPATVGLMALGLFALLRRR